MAKKATTTKTTNEPEVTETPKAPLRRIGDSSVMLSAEDVLALHGEDVIRENERKAREIRERNA